MLPVTTLGEAWKLGWRVRVRCLWLAPGAKSSPGRLPIQCETTAELDMKTARVDPRRASVGSARKPPEMSALRAAARHGDVRHPQSPASA
jgi:hypothetical protein